MKPNQLLQLFSLVLAAATFLSLPVYAQQQECLTFDNAGINYCAQWETNVASCQWVQNPPNHPSPAMLFRDESGGPSLAWSRPDLLPFFRGN